jgi:hypothetical protein
MPTHYDSAYSSQPNVALVGSLYGEPVEGSVPPNATDNNVALATGTYFRPYERPLRKSKELNRFDKPKVLCATDGCRAFPTKTGHCVGHSRSLGLIENWNQEGRKPNEPD